MDILSQNVGYIDKETGATVVLVPGTVIPKDLDDKVFIDFLEDEKLLERAPRGYKPTAKQSYFYLKEDAVGTTDQDDEDTDDQTADDALKGADTGLDADAQQDDPGTDQDDADPNLFSVGAAALAELTVADVEELAKGMSTEELDDLEALETTGEGRNRKGIKAVIVARRKELAES